MGPVEFSGEQLKDLAPFGPKLISPPAMGSSRRSSVEIMLLEEVVDAAAPIVDPFGIPYPPVGQIDFIHDKPQEDRPAVAPTCDHVAVQLRLVLPRHGIVEEIGRRTNQPVSVEPSNTQG